MSFLLFLLADLISTKSQGSAKKAAAAAAAAAAANTDTERLSSSNSSALGTSSSGEMYENMTFHRKVSLIFFEQGDYFINRNLRLLSEKSNKN